MGGHGAIEVAKTVLEVADLAWKAMETTHHHHLYHHQEVQDDSSNREPTSDSTNSPPQDLELESLRSENQRLRNLLEQNLKLLQNNSESPCTLQECPSDLYARLVATVDSENFLSQLDSLQHSGCAVGFPFKEAPGEDVRSAEVLVDVKNEEPSWWVWVADEKVPSNGVERSGIDDEHYVVITEELVVDGVATFMAKCILSNPKAQKLTPEELQKVVAEALVGVSKFEKVMNIWHAGMLIYTLTTWGLALAGLYWSRNVLKLAVKGVHTTSKAVLKVL